jgi:sucrose-6-phosphate hydrolase SacC (GH32 family)
LNGCSEAGLVLRCSKDGVEKTVVGYDVASGELFLDRRSSGESGFHPKFAGKHRAPLKLKRGELELRILVDTSSVEVFGDSGAVCLTDRIFPAPDSRSIRLFAREGVASLESFKVYPIRSVWTQPKVGRPGN